MDFLTQLLMGQTAPFTGSPGQAGFPAIIDPRNKLGGLRTQVLPDPLNPQPGAFPGAPAYPPLGQSLQPQQMMANNGVVPTTSTRNAEGQLIDENGNPIQSYGRGERPFGSSAVAGGGGGGALPVDTGRTEAGGGGPMAPSSGNRIADALRGLASPRPPDVVKPSTPHLPPLRPIEGGGLVQLMASLGISPKDIPSLRSALGR